MDFMSRGPGVLFSIAVVGLVMSIIVYLWQSVMGVGYEGYALALVRGEDPDAGKLFCAFPRIGGVLVTRILTGIFVFLWSLLLGVGRRVGPRKRKLSAEHVPRHLTLRKQVRAHHREHFRRHRYGGAAGAGYDRGCGSL